MNGSAELLGAIWTFDGIAFVEWSIVFGEGDGSLEAPCGGIVIALCGTVLDFAGGLGVVALEATVGAGTVTGAPSQSLRIQGADLAI